MWNARYEMSSRTWTAARAEQWGRVSRRSLCSGESGGARAIGRSAEEEEERRGRGTDQPRRGFRGQRRVQSSRQLLGREGRVQSSAWSKVADSGWVGEAECPQAGSPGCPHSPRCSSCPLPLSVSCSTALGQHRPLEPLPRPTRTRTSRDLALASSASSPTSPSFHARPPLPHTMVRLALASLDTVGTR